MSRRLLIAIIIVIPALALIVWLVAAQLPRWTAPQPSWFGGDIPGVCAAVESLKLYDAQFDSPGGMGALKALQAATKIVSEHYQFDPGTQLSSDSPVLGVQATLPGDQRRSYYVIVIPLTNDPLPKVAVIYLDAATGEARALITGIDNPAQNCNFDVRAALVAAAKSLPVLLLIAYSLLVIIALVARWVWRGRHR